MTSVSSADEAIATFKKHPTPLAFLSVVQGLNEATGAKKLLTALWEEHRDQVTPLTADDVAGVLSWLSQISPRGTFKMPRQGLSNPLPEWLKDVFDAVETGAPAAREMRHARKRITDVLFANAGHFGAGYFSYPHFAEFFREQNPVDVIGEHTRLWFASESAGATEGASTWWTPSSNICTFLHAAWLPALGRMIDGRRNDNALKQLASWLRSNQTLPLVVGRPEYFSASRSRRAWQLDFALIADTLPLFPQTYFERVLDVLSDYLTQSDWFDDETQYDYVGGLCDVLLSLPIGATSHHALADLHDGALTALVQSYGLHWKHLPFVPLSRCQSLLWGCSCVSENVFREGSEQGRALDAAPASEFYLCDRDEYHTLCSHISDACDQQLAANAPIPYDWVGLAGECLAQLTHPDNLAACPLPLPLLLATTYERSEPAIPPPHWTPYSWACLTASHFSRADAECGLQAAELAAKSHYWELANALFAFVVFRGLLESKTALPCEWPRLMTTCRLLEGTPGHDMSVKALTITADALQHLSPRSFHSSLLQQWSRSRHTQSATHGVKWKELEEILRDQLLNAVWPRLPSPVQSQIMNAEALWTLQHRYLGTTDPPIGANLVVEYAKCIEVPLKERLRPVLDSQAFKEYQARQGKNPHDRPTLGTMVHLLLDRQLPLPLQGEMRRLRMSGVDIAALQAIAPELKTIPHQRNDGAHANVTGVAAMKFRERLYGGGLFARICSALFPA